MLCIKGFAGPLCYLLSLLSPEPAQLLGRIKLLGCSTPFHNMRRLFLGRAQKSGALEFLLAFSSGPAHTDKEPAGSRLGGCLLWSRLVSACSWEVTLLHRPLLCSSSPFLLAPSVPAQTPRSTLWPCLLVVSSLSDSI